MNKIRKHRKLIATLPVLALLLMIPSTFAFFTQNVEAVNAFYTPTYRVEIQEEFTPIDNLAPGIEVPKVVKIANTGKTHVYLRLRYEEAWTPEDLNLETEAVIKDWTEYAPEKINTEWVKVEDNGEVWYYYNKVLYAGEETETILNSIKLSENVSNDDEHGPNYGKATYTLTFIKEDIQAVTSAAIETWAMQPTINEQTEIITWAAYTG